MAARRDRQESVTPKREALADFNLERKMDEQEEAEEAENQWHTNMDGLTRKS